MTDHIFKQERGWLEQAIARVYDNQSDGEDALLLAMFADGVLRNLTDTVLKPAWLGTKKPSPAEAAEHAACRAAAVFMRCKSLKRPMHEMLELAYWAFYAEFEGQRAGKKSKSVASLGPTLDEIERTLEAWGGGSDDTEAPLATRNVNYLKMRETVFLHLNKFGLGIDGSEADWFKKTKMAARQK